METSHSELSPNFVPIAEAVDQWRARHETWAAPKIYESLDPFLDTELRAIRDHKELSETGIVEFVDKAEAYGSKGADWTNEAFSVAAARLSEALELNEEEKGLALLFGLQDTDGLLAKVVRAKEQEAIRTPEIARAFAHEVLIEKPLGGEAISEEELEELIPLDNDPETGSTGATFIGKLIYFRSKTMTARGVYEWFGQTLGVPPLQGATPKEIAETASLEDCQFLLDYVVGSL